MPLSNAFGPDVYASRMPELRTLALREALRSFPKKTILINDGEEGDSLFVLLKGSVKVFAMDQEGREITYGKIQAGDTLAKCRSMAARALGLRQHA